MVRTIPTYIQSAPRQPTFSGILRIPVQIPIGSLEPIQPSGKRVIRMRVRRSIPIRPRVKSTLLPLNARKPGGKPIVGIVYP